MKNLLNLLPAFRSKLVIPVISVIALFLFVGFVSFEATKVEVNVTQNGETTTVETHAETVADLIDELELNVGEHDLLSHKTDELITANMDIQYKQAKNLVLTIDEEEEVYYTTQDTVASFLEEAEVEVGDHDVLSVDPSAAIENDLEIELNKAMQVTINDGGEEKQVWTTEETISDLLADQSIELNELDRVEPEETKDVTADSAVTITRVEKVTDIVEETIDYSTVTKSDNSLTKGKEEVVTAGEEGLVEKKYEVTLENGEEVERELINEEIKKESEKRVVAVGTKEEVATTVASTATETVSRGDSSSKTLYMKATAYTANCNGCSGITSTGIDLKSNPNAKVIAVDSSVIPLGTKVWVEGYGNAVAGDTGGAISGNKIDVHVSSNSEALSFGVRNVKVKILD
ncbi:MULTISPECIES: G5 and 3D domain-containing protein [Paraliobacillus]|uniref:G5 and 3D domain-containing protein n=1 Tax=Paraliobacillus TaxID=200903 RepID=UPI000E3DBB14|nr:MULTISPECIES: G5 and 3D domain-containing protein [Paraliobacillus]